MGGSLAMVLKERQLCRRVVAWVRRDEAARAAESLGVVDQAATDPAHILPQADVVVFATPVRILMKQLIAFSPFYKPGAIITDLGSTKQEIIEVMADLPAELHPIGSHPMCGKEQAGLMVAEPQLYDGAPWILVPLARTPANVTEFMTNFAQAIGAKPRQLTASRHDQLVAAISHTPYLLATALVLTTQQIAKQDSAVWEVAASGFRDSSRLAASDVTMMLDILLTNRDAVLEILGQLNRQLGHLTDAVADMDETALRRLMDRAANQRRKLYQ